MTESKIEDPRDPKNDLPEVVDLRDLEAPEPMQRVLMACTQLGSDEKYLVHLQHVPHPLFPHLQARDLQWRVFEQTDGSARVLIWRAT
jgi:hypothetical protein